MAMAMPKAVAMAMPNAMALAMGLAMAMSRYDHAQGLGHGSGQVHGPWT